ncbi:MAG: HAD family hydrolase [Myxococcales bacterium]|nr:HAD family hydrolase [Myxococcales bacterium]
MERKLLILDLDETLLYGTEEPLDRLHDEMVEPYHIYKRPALSEFLSFASELFDLAIWTSSSEAYAEAICEVLFSDGPYFSFVWARGKCKLRRDIEDDTWVLSKPLRKLKSKGYDLRDVLMVDDSPEKHTQNYGNLVRVAPYLGDENDDELAYLATYLEQLVEVEDVRRVEKRRWRASVEPMYF